MAITISRGPESSRHWSGPGFRPEILILHEGVASKAMMEVNKNAAIKAFGQALSQGIV